MRPEARVRGEKRKDTGGGGGASAFISRVSGPADERR